MESGRSQAQVVAFLEGGGLGEPVERIDTHGAHVFLGRERAWKLKRAVRFSFMDLSTLAQREAATRAELELNRRTAPELYRRVLPVTRADGGRLALGGAGEPVEWLLEMRRFPAEAQLNRVAARGELTGPVVDRLAQVVADFHAAAEPRPAAGGAAVMREVVEGNAGDLADLAPRVFGRDAVTALTLAAATELDRQAGLLDRRREAGAVRRCHGDLHLGNIVLLDDRPVLFDCLEFSERLAAIDVLYDLAFLVMDLLERGLRAEAWRLLQAYNNRRSEDEGLALLPLFLSVRAVIRAKVTGFTALSPEHGGDREQLGAQARAYLALACAALKRSPAMLVAIGGRSGTSKSSVAMIMAPQIGAMPGDGDPCTAAAAPVDAMDFIASYRAVHDGQLASDGMDATSIIGDVVRNRGAQYRSGRKTIQQYTAGDVGAITGDLAVFQDQPPVAA
jgi:aminoglycoside phosphotransferase family enzyme